MGDERTNEVFFDNVFVPDDYVVGELNRGFQYISEALDLERFTMFTFSPIKARLDLLVDYVKTAKRDGEPLRDDPVVRQRVAQLATEAEVARVLGLRFVAQSMKGGARAHGRGERVQAVRHRVLQAARQRVDGPRPDRAPSSACGTEDAPMKGRAESTYRYTVLDTIGGGTSEVQKNIIARRKLGLPKNF